MSQTKIECECGGKYKKYYIPKHLKTKTHRNNLIENMLAKRDGITKVVKPIKLGKLMSQVEWIEKHLYDNDINDMWQAYCKYRDDWYITNE
jgi:predicted ATPase